MQSQSQGAQGTQGAASGLFHGYPALPGTYDEMFDGGVARPAFARVAQLLAAMGKPELARAQALAELSLLNQG